MKGLLLGLLIGVISCIIGISVYLIREHKPHKKLTCADCARAGNDDFCMTRDENDDPYEGGKLCPGFIALDDEEKIREYLS